MNREDKIIYKITSGLYRFLESIKRNIDKASRELNFIRYKLVFGEKDDDIYIITYPKSGTTLMQMLLYQLTTDGNVDFNHIYDVSPWIKNDAFKHINPRTLDSPRLIKSHDSYSDFDRAIKGRFIYVHRNGMDVAVSQFYQIKNYMNPDITFEKFLDDFFDTKGYNYFTFTRQWRDNKKGLPIMYISYEAIIDDFESTLKQIAEFLKIPVNDKDIPRIKERCSFDFMKKHEEKFGEQPPEKKMVYDQFIRRGTKNSGETYFNTEQKNKFIEYHNKFIKD